MADVFISYRRTERPQVERIASTLRQLDLDIWFDARLSAGESFGEEIDREVRSAKVVLVCWSPDAIASPWVRAEAQIGFRRRIMVSTWAFGPDEFEIPVPFNTLQLEDLRSWIGAPDNRHPAWRSVLRGVGRLTERPDLVGWGRLGEDASDREVEAWLEKYGATSPLAAQALDLVEARKAEAKGAGRGAPRRPFPPANPSPPKPGATLWRRIFGAAGEIAIDVGTANTRIFLLDHGIVLDEPTVIADERVDGRRRLKAVGDEVAPLLTGVEGIVKTIYPLRNGVIVDFDAAEAMLKHFIAKVRRTHALPRKLEVVVGTPAGATRFQREVIRDAALGAGAGKVMLIEAPMAAAIGAGLPVTTAKGSLIADIGAGKAEVAVVSVRGRGYLASIRAGGIAMDEVISSYVRRNHNLLIGEATAERIKKQVGIAKPPTDGDGLIVHIKGRDLVNGVPKEITINQRQIAEALSEPVGTIVEGVRIALENTMPELAADMIDQGIVLTGGAAQLRGLDEVLRDETGLAVTLADEPASCVARGMGGVLGGSPLRSVLIAV